jgi:23S rRNA pseudouridine1911/1915/1917 synthase
MPDPRDGRFLRPPHAAPERLDRVLRAFRPHLSWSALRDLVARGKVAVDGSVVRDPGTPVAGGVEVVVAVERRSGPGGPAAPGLPRDRIVFADRFVVVVEKPAGVDTVTFVPRGRVRGVVTAPPAPPLVEQVAAVLGSPVRVVHRLDRDTTGLLAFARNAEAEASLAGQWRRHTVHRRYLALAHGAVQPGTIRSFLAADRGDGLRGATHHHALGREAITHVEVVERLRGATLVACRLETGRTHQIRIHLAEAGHMLLGERGYVRDHGGPVLPAPRILLHAAELGFSHPASDQPLRFSSPLPADMADAVAGLRG